MSSDEKLGEELLSAARNEDKATLECLLGAHPRLVNYKNSGGVTPLHWAALSGRIDIMSLLFQRGASHSWSRDLSGRTPLHIAAYDGNLKAIYLILHQQGIGMDHTIRNMCDRTPADEARRNNQAEAAALLDRWKPAQYVDGDYGIMLVRTESLRLLLQREDMTSEEIMEMVWKKEGNIFSLLPKDSFIAVPWADLRSFHYAVISYQWKSKWHALAKFIFDSKNGVRAPYMWIDGKCLDQMNSGKMKTITKSDEIYRNAKEYHLMEIGSLFRGWVLFELSSVVLAPIIHSTTQDPAIIQMAKAHLSSRGFDGCQSTENSDREIVRRKIIERHGTMAKFNEKIIKIVNDSF